MALHRRYLLLGVTILIAVLNRLVTSQTTNHNGGKSATTSETDEAEPIGLPDSLERYSIVPGINLVDADESAFAEEADATSEEPGLSVGGGAREGHFPSNGRVEVPSVLHLHEFTSLSLRTCASGTFLYQVGDSSDSIKLELDENGLAVLTVTKQGQTFTSTIPSLKLNDNQWHRIYLKYELGSLILGADSTEVVVASTTGPNSPLLDISLQSTEPRLIIGGGLDGCFLEGANTPLSGNSSAHFSVSWNTCNLPLGRNCSGYDTDPCFSEPCGKRGTCTPMGTQFICDCYSRYSGEACDIDSGPLCLREENMCQNEGVCQEDYFSNSTYCACPTGFMGSRCEVSIQSYCSENPCMNNGTCVVGPFNDQFKCVCEPGFKGTYCEEEENFCSYEPCLHGGTCSLIPNGFICDCTDTGYRGDLCDVNVNECEELFPCLSGSTCYDFYGGYDCVCVPGFGGDDCSLNIHECSSNPCLNGGQCTDGTNDFTCLCPRGFEGKRCEIDFDDCRGMDCPPNSVCVDGINNYECQCQLGYAGTVPNCTRSDKCDSDPCVNGASCFDGNENYTCICLVGFTGRNCETNVDDCVNIYCENGGTCVDGVNNYTCACQEGFTGVMCERNLNECEQNVCVHALRCIDSNGDYECVCEPMWTGKNCDREVNPCVSEPCLNNGTCEPTAEGGFTCSCLPGFQGTLCDMDIDDCEGAACQNGAACIDGRNNYTCVCPDTYMGSHCEGQLDICSASQCLNGASCIPNFESMEYYCQCLPGFEGPNCGVNIDDCVDVVCEEEKICVDLANAYECRCPAGFSGDNCSVNVDECESSPCRNGGTCSDAIANYTCVCPSGYTGHSCEEDVDECVLIKPCVNGICVNTNGSYECYCTPGFSGDNCSLEFDECLYLPCQNGGTCINMINSYQCECSPGFTGSECETNIDECESQPCQNNATCIDGIANFTCECLPGFTDVLCSTNIDECESNPCQNEGECQDLINEYECDCTNTGFKGDHCEINIDDCESSPCVHGSNCTDLIKDYNCSCYDGYTGKNCEEDIAECASSPCQNEGNCFEYSNVTYYEIGIFEDFSYETAGGFLCECQLGFTGDFCEINIDECESNPCQYGECIDGINAYNCDCYPGYEGEHCETEIDECERFEPCVNGTCTDKVADYECECVEGYGGKNCSVLMLGCQSVVCENGGTCVPILIDERVHEFRCDCLPGFTERYCELSTTLSMDGNAYLSLDSQGSQGYHLEMSFRTTLPNVVLAVGQGDEHYYTLVLSEGRLKLHSSFLSRYNGIFAGSDLNDGNWQFIKMLVNDTHSLLSANNETTQHSLTSTSPVISFITTFLGGVTPNLKILVNEPLYTGCMRDVTLNDQEIIPSNVPSESKVNVIEGCDRVPQCDPSPCHNDGQCLDLWTSFKCICKRPYLGDTCRMSFTPGTFGNEDIRDSLATVRIPSVDQETFRRHVDISMLVRTRQDAGLIFYLGSPIDSTTNLEQTNISYLLSELDEGKVVIKLKLDGPVEVFLTNSPFMADGAPHLLHVERNNDKLHVKVDDEISLNTTLENNGDLTASVLYLGGIPLRKRRRKRQTGEFEVNLLTNGTVPKNHFKGVLQDIRLTSGNKTRIVELFPLNVLPDENYTLPGNSINVFDMVHVLNGTVSDDTCRSNPCLQGGICNVTFNDFECTCPTGFKGKICDELEYCAMFDCPTGAECRNLKDGYECVTNATFNGRNSSYSYETRLSNISQFYSFSTMYRSKVGGVLMAASVHEASLWVGVAPGAVGIQQVNGSSTAATFYTHNILDGQWHHLNVTFAPSGLMVYLDNISLPISGDGDAPVIVDFDVIVRRDGIHIGSLPEGLTYNPSIHLNVENALDTNATDPLPLNQHFRGCLGDTRVGPLLLPFYSPEELANNTAENVFTKMASVEVSYGCEVCFQYECQNNGQCLDPNNTYTCTCPPGFEGPICEINIDECQYHKCENNATCIDGISEYKCKCLPGYEGEYCETEIDECESGPCQNGGSCFDEIATFTCICPDDFIGTTCSELKIKNCSNNQCQNGATCNDIFNPETGVADNYTCECPFSYKGINCQEEIDFCTLEQIRCERGDCILTHMDKGWKCECEEGYEGEFCQNPTNECLPEPCLNGGTCVDHHLFFTCQCQSGWTGTVCDENINECLLEEELCKNGGECIDADGSYFCECPKKYCGQHCNMLNPCEQDILNCTNGECTRFCDERTSETEPICVCFEGWEGTLCDKVVSTVSTEFLTIIITVVVGLMLLIAVVGLVIFFMMAKKKRETSGTYSPSKQEFYSPRVEMGNMIKQPPEERLI